MLTPGRDAAWDRRLANYWSARNRYLAVGRDVTPSRDVRQMLAQVRGPLMSALRISADFRPAYEPLERMAQELARTDPPEAQALLAQITQLRSI